MRQSACTRPEPGLPVPRPKGRALARGQAGVDLRIGSIQRALPRRGELSRVIGGRRRARQPDTSVCRELRFAGGAAEVLPSREWHRTGSQERWRPCGATARVSPGSERAPLAHDLLPAAFATVRNVVGEVFLVGQIDDGHWSCPEGRAVRKARSGYFAPAPLALDITGFWTIVGWADLFRRGTSND
jgi:hypothetical protein